MTLSRWGKLNTQWFCESPHNLFIVYSEMPKKSTLLKARVKRKMKSLSGTIVDIEKE